MLLDMQDTIMHGDQRNIHIQLIKNKRRLKRGSKRKRSGTKTIVERVTHIFNTGTINDYTHPKEVDPYWDILYRQYEYLVYVELLYKSSIKKCNVVLSDDDIVSIIHDFEYIKEHKRILLSYLMNFMNVMYGSVMQRRFYGWKYYIEDFISKFNEVAITNLTKLKFDVDQTRCSVYFYQAFWLSGLSITNKILDDIKKNASNEYVSSNAQLRNDYEDDIDSMYIMYGSDIIDTYNTLSETSTPHETEEVQITIETEVEITQKVETEVLLEEITENQAIEEHNYKDLIQTVEETDFEMFCTLKKLLYQIGVDHRSIHNFSDKKITKLGKLIRKKIATGEISLHEKEKTILAEFFTSSLLH